MALQPGSRLGSYEIVAPVGAGGMGEVWRAHDLRLGRDVAIKVLPAALAVDVERLARFDREAKTLASLNHPNIAQIFGIEESGGLRAFVMELVEGEDLSELAARGPLLPEAVLPIAGQLVDALEAAHEAGVVHRDLKPANIKVGRDGSIKVLDFGLAKAVDPAASSGVDLLQSPTMTAQATQAGIVIGTAPYMSPEQARGQAVDKRADIWALGVILFELLSGERLFDSPTVSDTLAAVLRAEIDWDRLPAGTPPALVALIRRCLERDPRRRLRDVGDARFELSAAATARATGTEGDIPASTRRRWWPTIALAVIALGSLAFALAVSWRRSTPAPSHPTYVSIALPVGHFLASVPAISRDGRRLAFTASDGIGRPQLWVRDLGEPESRLLEDTDDASSPFFSPDGEWIAYYAADRLRKVRASGGASLNLARSTSHVGGTWTDDGTIVFNQSWNGGLSVVGENGGQVDSLLSLQSDSEYAYIWPYAVPGEHDILYASWGVEFATNLLDARTKETRIVVPGWWRRFAWVTGGYLISASSGEIRALKLDSAGGTSGEATTLVADAEMGGVNGDPPFDVSQEGTLVYVQARDDDAWLAYIDRDGRSTRLPTAAGPFGLVRLSPDGRRAVVQPDVGLSVVDLERGTMTPLVPELSGHGGTLDPVWSPDGRSVTFGSNKDGNWDIYRRAANGTGEIATVLSLPADQQPESYAPDGTLFFRVTDPNTGNDIWSLPPGGEPRPWLATAANELGSRFSPDGRLVSYISDASGRFEVYVQSRDDAEVRTQVSVDGGDGAVWSPRGDLLYFHQGALMMQADIRTTDGLVVGTPERVFGPSWTIGGYDLMPDGERFLVVEFPPNAIPTRIDLVLDWPALLETSSDR